jgi:hypothetical protein
MKITVPRFAITIAWLLVASVAVPSMAWAQNKKDKNAEIKNIVEAQNYVFIAQTVLPSAGPSRQLTGDFDLRVSKDTIVSYLPYFGRGYSAPIDPTKGPLQFTSTSFQYTVTNKKKGGWDITIATKDLQDRKQLSLSIFENGNTTVTVVSNNQQPISFTGYIRPKK